MRMRLLAMCKDLQYIDYDLVDILRALSRQNGNNVIDHYWIVTDADFGGYKNNNGGSDYVGLKMMFPEAGEHFNNNFIVVSGERLMERSALIHQCESGRFLRLLDASTRSELSDRNLSDSELDVIRKTKSDIEIFRYDFSPFEVIFDDENIFLYLQTQFAVTELVDSAAS